MPGFLIPVKLEVIESGFNSKSNLKYSIEPKNPYFEMNQQNGEIKTISNQVPNQKETILNIKVSNGETSAYAIVRIVLLNPYSGVIGMKEIHVEENLEKVWFFKTILFYFK